MNNCKKCGTETKNPKYCSQSCCNSFQGSLVAERWKVYREDRVGVFGTCKNCSANLSRKSKYCSRDCRWSFERANSQFKRTDEELFCLRIDEVVGYSLKGALVSRGHRELKCENCGLDTWLDKPIPLEVDHVNGNRLDNRLENLKILCRNCHGQTPTFGILNSKKYKESR